ncbi:MAG: serine/threonine-protein kinase PknK [Myxococcales bacterium]|nr:serine/threonine-protein kinase PknK [Myxococcales bacterium]
MADLEADRLRALMRATVFGQPRQPVTIDRYEIVRLLGSGAMGLVYEVFDPKRGEQVALKTLRGQSPRALSLFKREFRALSRINHPNLVALYELGRDEHQFFFTMELVRGSALLKYLWGSEPEGPLPEETPVALPRTGLPPTPVADFARLRGVFHQLAEGVHALHQAHKLHRDIKPTNVMVTPHGRVVLMDFGFVGEQSVGGSYESTAGSMVVGTPAYMAPEQAIGGPRDAACDWYSVGATLYMALTGQIPFHGESLPRMMERKQQGPPPAPRTLVAGAPEDLDALCMQLLSPDPKQRPSGADVLARLHAPGLEVSLGRGAYLSPAATHVGARRFVGREPAVQALRDAYAAVCTTGQPVVVLARGRAGIGKSALVRHVTDELKSTAVVLRARCYERDSVPLKALDSLIDALARHLRQRPRPELAPTIASLAPLFPVLHPTDDPVAELARRGGELDRAAFIALRELFSRLSSPRPAVLWIDDFQWGDPGSAYALQRIVRPPDSPPLLLIASYRSEDSATSPALHALSTMSDTQGLDVRVVELSPLDASEALRLAEAVLGQDTAPARLRKLANEAQGSPQFLHDLARFVAHGPGASPELTLDELLEIRMARLAAAPRRLLEVVAVAGQPIAETFALKAAGVEQDGHAAVQQLLALGLLRSLSAADGDRLDAYHDRAREIVLTHLDGPGLRQLHQDLAAALEACEPTCDPLLLVRLHRGAGDLLRARQHAANAAASAFEKRLWDRAASLYALAADLSSSPSSASEFHLHRADALARSGRSAAAAEAYLAARTGTEEHPGRWNPPAVRLTAFASALLLTAGHREAGKAALAAGFAAVGLSPPAATVGARLAALWRRGQMAVRGTAWTERAAASVPEAELARVDLLWAAAIGDLACEPVAAADVQAQHLLLALQTGEPRRVARALVVDAGLAAHLGPGGRTRMEVALQEARRLAQRLGDASIAALADLVEGSAASLAGDWLMALARAEARTVDDDHGLPWTLWVAHLQGLRALHQLGRWTTVQARLPGLLGLATDRDDRCARVWLHALAVWNLLAANDVEAARRELAAAEAAWPYPPAAGYHLQHLQIAEARTAVLLYAGEPARAWQAVLDESPAFMRSGHLQTPAFLLSALDIRARCALAALRGSPRDGSLRRAALRAADDLQATGGRGHADLVRAGASDPDLQTAYASPAAARLLHSAAHAFEAAQLGIHLAVARLRLGDPAASAALTAQGARDPRRLAAVLAP